jgi:hypothetical protein
MSTCDVCKREIDDETQWCSEFCNVVGEGDRLAYRNLKPGEWGIWPCSECGCPIEDELPAEDSERICSTCWPKVKAKKLTALLTEALPHLPGDLAARVQAALKL